VSTKHTIDFGDDHHLYAEMFDGERIYLELSGPGFRFTTSRDHATIAIPFALWERLRAVDVSEVRRMVHEMNAPEADEPGGRPDEDRVDAEDARKALAEIEARGTIPWDVVKAELEI
jgi:hypothetical protein